MLSQWLSMIIILNKYLDEEKKKVDVLWQVKNE